MKPMSEMAAQLAPTLLRMQGRALGLVLASVAALMIAAFGERTPRGVAVR